MLDWLWDLGLVALIVVVVLTPVAFLIICWCVAVTEMKDYLTQSAIRLMEWRARKLKRLIDEELCRHGLSSDGVLTTLLGLDHFSFVMDGTVCTCVRRADGTHDFGFPTPQDVLAVESRNRLAEEMAAVALDGRAGGRAEPAEAHPGPTAETTPAGGRP